MSDDIKPDKRSRKHDSYRAHQYELATERRERIIAMRESGMTFAQIGRDLGISRVTVRNHYLNGLHRREVAGEESE